MQIAKPSQSLRKVILQRSRELIGQCRSLVDQFAAAFAEQLNAACQHVIRNQDAQVMPVTYQDIQ